MTILRTLAIRDIKIAYSNKNFPKIESIINDQANFHDIKDIFIIGLNDALNNGDIDTISKVLKYPIIDQNSKILFEIVAEIKTMKFQCNEIVNFLLEEYGEAFI